MREWVEAYYAAFDAGDYDAVEQHFTPGVVTRFADGAVVEGRDRLMRITRRSMAQLAGIAHRVVNVWREGDTVLFELTVTYERRDGTTIDRPGMGIFELAGDVIREQRLFVDGSGVWED